MALKTLEVKRESGRRTRGEKKGGCVRTVTLASLSQSASQEGLCDLARETTEAGLVHSQQGQVELVEDRRQIFLAGSRGRAVPAVSNLVAQPSVRKQPGWTSQAWPTSRKSPGQPVFALSTMNQAPAMDSHISQ